MTEPNEKKLQPIINAAMGFVEKMSEPNNEPSDRVASHRILYLSVKQFDAWIALKTAVQLSQISDEEQAGVKMIIYLQSLMGIVETPAKALEGWRRMSAISKQNTFDAYETLKKKEVH